jgi:hypothetical protein
MKKIFFAAFATMAFISCNQNNAEPYVADSGEKIQLTVKLPENATKVTGTPTDAQINDLQIFVFDKNGVYETSSHGAGSSLTLTCTSGDKCIVALANAPLETGVTSISDLRSRTSDLKDCSAGSIVMSGEVTQTLTASATVNMQVERLAARVSVSSISTDFELDQHKSLSFEVKAVYLINVAGDKAYLTSDTPSVWYNQAKYEQETSPVFLYDAVTAGTVTADEAYDTQHYFYCYPNATSTKTRLVVEAEVGGYTYYYPVTLNSVDANTAYDYALTITRLGSDSPDVPVVEGTVNFTVTVKDWVEQNVNETI